MAGIDFDTMVRMLRGAAEEVKVNHDELSRLDSFGGDGDHGTTMMRAMNCMEKVIDSLSEREIKMLLHDVGWAIMGVDGGATGPLLGTFFMGMSDETAGDAIDTPELAAMFEAGLAKVRKQTKAQVGDKTVLDALVPAVDALRAAGDGALTPEDALERAAAAAEQGAASTKELQARFGRAKNIKEKSIGTQDPGATSVALIFRGFSKGAQANA
jgi:phosphoenolpyruvate---glycerone phosphotransferase subunit DhaL